MYGSDQCNSPNIEFNSITLRLMLYVYSLFLCIVPDFSITISPPGPIQGAMVGDPLVANCTMSTVDGVEPSIMP